MRTKEATEPPEDLHALLEQHDKDWKRKVLELIKTLKLDEKVIADPEYQKWYRFGAYDFGARLSDRIKEIK